MAQLESVHRSCPICEASCGLVFEVDRAAQRVVRVRGDEDDPRSRGYVCPKAVAAVHVHEDPDRIRTPLRRVGPPGADARWQEIGWDEAYALLAERLRAIRAAHGNDAIGVYIGNPTGHDYGAMLYTTFFMQALATHRMFSGATVDQYPKNVSCRLMLGDAWLFPIPDIDRTDHLLVLGANPLVSNGSLMSAPNVKARLAALRARGGKLVVVDPRRTETAEIADAHHFIRPGSDALLLLAMIQVLFDEGRVAPGRLADFTDGIEVVEGVAREFTPERVAPATGIAPEAIRGLARDLARATRAICYGRFGTCTQEFGTLASWATDVINILTGNFDRAGGMMFPRAATGQTEPVAEPAAPMEVGAYRSRVRGLPTVEGQLPAAVMAEEIDAAGEERMRAMITVAGNPVLSTPNGERLARALAALEFMVSVDIYRNETTRMADLILPTTTQLEHDNYDFLFTTTSVRNMARYSPCLFEPAPGAKHHWEVLLELAAHLNAVPAEKLDELLFQGVLATFVGKPGTPAADVTPAQAAACVGSVRGPRRLLDAMLRAGPYGDGFDDTAEGLSLAKLAAIPHALDLGPLEPRLPALLRTPGRRIALAPQRVLDDLPRLRRRLDAAANETGLLLVGRRQMRNMNSWLHNLEPLAKGPNRCTLLIHPEDAKRAGLADGATARVRSRVGAVCVPVEVSDEMMPGVVSLPHGFGHATPGTRLSVAARLQPGASVSALIDEQMLDEPSGTSALSGIPVEVRTA